MPPCSSSTYSIQKQTTHQYTAPASHPLRNLERGRGNPTLDVLEAVARALSTTVPELLGDVSESSVGVVAAAPNSLQRFTRTDLFRREIVSLASRLGRSEDEVREEFVVGLASAPRRSSGEPTEDDWKHLFRTFKSLLDE